MAYIKSVTSTDNTTYDIKSKVTNGIPYGECDSTSTATVFTATVEGLDALYDGACVMLKNGVITSAANFTINVNNLGAKPCYNNMATGNDITPTAPTRDTTIFNQNYTMLFVYSEDIVDGGGWICYRGYDGNTNTIGYQLRTNSSNLVAADTGYRYRIWLTSADGSKWVPINTSTSTNATTTRSLNTRAIDPFGAIVYRATNGTCNSGAGIGATGIWQQYTLTIGYSYVKTLTFPAPVYLKCTPQSNGSAVMNDVVQALPTSNDGKIYIFLGVAYSASSMELQAYHPVYWHDGTGIRIWTGTSGGGGEALTYTLSGAVSASSAPSLYDAYDYKSTLTPSEGTASTSTLTLEGSSAIDLDVSGTKITVKGSSLTAASGGTAVSAVTTGEKYTWNNKQDALVSGTNIKTINGNSLLGSGDLTVGGGSSVDPATATPLMDGTAAVGTSAKYAREDHRHPSDTNKVNTTYSSGTITNTIDSNEYGIYGLTSDSSANTSGTVGTSATGAYLTASNTSGIYTLEATTTGFGATYIDGTTFETETIFDFTAMTEQEIASAVDAGWGAAYSLSAALAQNTYHFYDSFDSSTNTYGNEITEAEAGSTLYFSCEGVYASYQCNVKDESGTTTLTTGTYIKSASLMAYFSFTMPDANVKVYMDGNAPK